MNNDNNDDDVVVLVEEEKMKQVSIIILSRAYRVVTSLLGYCVSSCTAYLKKPNRIRMTSHPNALGRMV